MDAKNKARFVRLTFALALCGIIASQLPMNPSVALAGDGYVTQGGGFLSLRGEEAVKTATIAGAAIGAVGVMTAGGGASAAAAAAGAGAGVTGVAAGVRSGSVYDVVQSLPSEFSELTKILESAQQVTSLREGGPYTFFLPSNTALEKELGREKIQRLQSPVGQADAVALLNGMLVKGSYSLSRLESLASSGGSLKTLSGETITLTKAGEKLLANGVELVGNEFPAVNGFVLVTPGLVVKPE